MFTLAHPILLCVGLVLVLPYLLRQRRVWQCSNIGLLQDIRRMGWPTWLLTAMTWLALGLLLLALAKPLRGTERTKEVLEARDILLTLNLSLSMEGFLDWNGKDLPPTKLALIRDAVLEFVRGHQHDRVGLIVFGDDAFGVWPLSVDTAVLQSRLEHLNKMLPPALRGTHVAKAVSRSLDHFDEMGQAESKILLLLTDGLDSIEPDVEAQLIQRLNRKQVKLYVLGMQLNEKTSIVQLAHHVQGGYFNINNADELAQALRAIDRQEASRFSISHTTESRDLYPYFAVPGGLLLLFGVVCQSTWLWEL
jgi:Ca-activated chloride channel family protein